MSRVFQSPFRTFSPGSHHVSRGFALRIGPLLRPLVLAAVAVAVLPLQPGAIVADALWVIALVIIGMPHGAFDVAVLRDQIVSRGWRAAAGTAAIYTSLTAVAAACFMLMPSLTVVMFLGLSAHHFGVSDCLWTRGRPMRSVSDHIIGLSHGVVVLAVPFIASPVAAWNPFVQIAAAGGGSGMMGVDTSLTRTVAATLLFMAMLIQLTVWVSRRKHPRVVEQASVIVAATMLGLTAPPLLAIGVYFLVVHALGHCCRADATSRLSPSPGLRNAARVHWRSLPLTIPSIGIVLVIAATVFGGLGVSSVALAFLLFCVIGTLPHHLLWLSAFGPLRSQPQAEK